jgi:cholera toxin transcriptional activator
MPEDRGRRIFRFGAFEASEAAGELRKRGIRIKIHAQPFQVLMMLLERSTEVVTREEMRQQLWGKDTFVDFDHGLNTAVNKIREALDDSASKPRYIETVPGKGYRFLAPLERPIPGAVGDTPGLAGPTLGAVTTAAPRGRADEQPSGVLDESAGTILTAPGELPVASRKLVRTLLLLVQTMYVGFYVGALANLPEIHDIFLEAGLPSALMAALITTGAVLIPIRLYIFTAVAMNFQNLASKFGKMFPVLLILDLLWSVSPFLLIHHVSTGLALGMSAPLVYLPFAQRSLVLMYAHDRSG